MARKPKALVLIVPLLLLPLFAGCAATGTTYYGFEIGISNAPPPPRVVFVDEPEVVVVPGTRVYVVSEPSFGYDMFRYGSYWYVFSGGFWYRSSRYGGRYVVIDVRTVPRAIVTLPPERWKHHPHGGPPGQMKKRGRVGA
jgi:hypothetical protein